MTQVRIDPKSKNWPYLEAGSYGPTGCDFKAECEWTGYEIPSEEMPRFDLEGKRSKNYACIQLQVRPENGGLVNVRHWEPIDENTASRVTQWLLNVGVTVADDGQHDDKAPIGKKCVVVASEPSVDKDNPDRKFTRLREIRGVS